MRIQASKLFITYARCKLPKHIIWEGLHRMLGRLGHDVHRFCVVQEEHKKEGPDQVDKSLHRLHVHAIVILDSELGCFKSRDFDINGYHPNIKSLLSEPHAFKYLNKDFDPIHNYTEDEVVDLLLKAEEKMVKEPKKYGPKIDWNDVCSQLMEGVSPKDLVQQNKSLYMHLDKIMKNKKIYDRLMRADPEKLKERDFKWYYGPTGAGKSRPIYDKYGSTLYYRADEKYWGNYHDQDVVLYSDLDGHKFHWVQELKNVTDWYPFSVCVKCDDPLLIRPKTILVTSNYTIRELFKQYFEIGKRTWDEELVLAVERRFEQIYVPKETTKEDLRYDLFSDNYFFELPKSPSLFDPVEYKDISYDKLF